jgi:ribosomal protein S18 acetylase RimI-like enzyme
MTSAARIKALAEGPAKAFAIRPARPEDCGDIAMLHSFVMAPRDEAANDPANDPANDNGEVQDPVLQPYAELEDPGSLYVAGVAVTPEHRGRGLD